MVHHWILSCPRQYLDDRERRCRAQGAARGAALLVAGDLNRTLTEPENNQRGADITAALTGEVLKDMATYFLLRQRKWGSERRTWIMAWEGKLVRSRTDYILGTDHCLFWNVSVWDPRHNTDHYMVLGCL